MLKKDYGTCYAIRLNKCIGYTYEKINESCERFKKAICVVHTGSRMNNPHYHLIVHDEMNLQALRKHMLKYFNEQKGNRHMSIKKCDGDPKAWSYLFHEYARETFDVPIHKGYTENDLEKFKDEHIYLRENKYKGTQKIVIDIYEKLMKDKIDFKNGIYVFRYMMDEYKNLDWMPNKYTAIKIMMKLKTMYLENDHQGFKEWCDELYDSWGLGYI